MENIKSQIINQILYFIQGFNQNSKCNLCINCINNLPCPLNKNEMLHTIVTGPPGVGKTEFSKILGKIYKGLGILENGIFHEVKRSDLIGKYLGHTACLTQNAIDKAKGGILFIDEAYSLGSMQREDIFSKECIDTLTYNLSEKRDFLCIVAGYENALDKCLFSVNNGLRRRFSFTYNFNKYKPKELLQILKHKIYLNNWKLLYNEINDTAMENEIINLFNLNENNMLNYGGDVETLFLQCRIIHSSRIPDIDERYILSNEDIIKGFNNFKIHRGLHETNNSWKDMYI